MIKHIVMWNLLENHHGKNKNDLAHEMKKALMQLEPLIPEIKFMEVGVNELNPNLNYDVVLTVEFNNIEDLHRYIKHPEHLKIVEFVKEITTTRAAVDYSK